MTDYNNTTVRFLNRGLVLRDPIDALEMGQWARLQNVRLTREQFLSTREGRTAFADTGIDSAVHSLRRLGGSSVLIGAGSQLALDSSGTFATSGYSGNPLSIIPFKPEKSGQVFGYVADSLLMRKVKADFTDYKWGITAPDTAATFVDAGAGLLNSSAAGAIVYDWRYTYYSSSTGAESNPSPRVTTGLALASKKANVTLAASNDPQVDSIRLYRRGGTITDTWRLSITVPNLSGPVQDNQADATIALNEVLSLTNDVPFTTVDAGGTPLYETPLPYMWGPFEGGLFLGTGDPNRPGYVYWTNFGDPDSAARSNNLSVSSPREPLIGGFIYAAQPFTFSRNNFYALDYGGPNAFPTFVGRKIPLGKGVVAPWAFAVGPLVFFVSGDGVYGTDLQGNFTILSDDSIRPLFYGQTVNGYGPIDFAQTSKLRLAYSGQELHFLYQEIGGIRRHLVHHINLKRWEFLSATTALPSVVYGDEDQALPRVLIGDVAGAVYAVDNSTTTDAGGAIAVACTTGALDMGRPETLKEFGNAIVDANPRGGTITVTPKVNAEGTTLSSHTLTGSTRAQYPLDLSDTYAYNISFDFAWSGPGEIHQMDVLWHPDEERIKHWEFPETSHGLPGWQHVRDVYIGIRSFADATLTVVVDGTTHTYTLPSTAGERRKVHVFLDPVKGKMFQYRIDSASSFSLYGEDCEIRVKSWNTRLGYQLVSPFVKTERGT